MKSSYFLLFSGGRLELFHPHKYSLAQLAVDLPQRMFDDEANFKNFIFHFAYDSLEMYLHANRV